MSELRKEDREQLEFFKAKIADGSLHGRFENVPDCVYHHPELEAIGSTTIKDFSGSLAHLEATQSAEWSNQKKYTILRGSVFHCLLLEPQNFDRSYSVEPEQPVFGDLRKKENKAAKATWMAETCHKFEQELNGREAVPEKMMIEVRQMLAHCEMNENLKGILNSSSKEVTYFVKCKLTGLIKKCKADILALRKHDQNFDLLTDVKTCEDARDKPFGKHFVNMLYDVQMAYYSDIIKEVEGLSDLKVSILPVEYKEPFQHSLFPVDDSIIEVGREIYKHRIRKIAELRKSGERNLPKDFSPMFIPAFAYDVEARK